MKKISFALLLSQLLGCNLSKMPDSRMTSYYYSYYSCMAYPVLELDLNLVDDFVQVTIVEGIDTVRYKADRQLMDDVQRIFSERRMYRYKSSYRPKLKVLDGYSWHYSAKFANGESFSSSGNNAWPRGDAFDAIADLVKGYSPE